MIKHKAECQDHDYLSTDCAHCQRLIDLADAIVNLVADANLSPRETLLAINFALETAVQQLVAPRLGPLFAGMETDA